MEIVLGILYIIVLIVLVLGVISCSFMVGSVAGLFIGIFKGIKNYFKSLVYNLLKKHDEKQFIKCPYCGKKVEASEKECCECNKILPLKNRNKAQPAKVNYFFRDGYINLWRTIKDTFSSLGSDLGDAWGDIAEGWSSFWEGVSEIIEESGWDIDGWINTIKATFIFSFSLCKFLYMLFITSSLCILLSVFHVVILFGVLIIFYFFLLMMVILDAIFRSLKKISSNCPNCQDHFALPIYVCPNCGVEHTKLSPSRYGIWKRKCSCGEKIPTTFLNGRGSLHAICPVCNHDIKDGGQHVDLCIPVVGGASAGKTCFINQAIYEIGNFAEKYNLDYEYSPTDYDDYDDNINSIKNGRLPEKTNDMRLKYYQFYLTPKNKIKNLISLCDVGGEVYSDSNSLGEQIGYKYANAFLMVVDPLSIKAYLNELKETVDPKIYGYSSDSIDEITSMLISTLENMFCINSKDMLKTDVVVVLSKLDIPGLSEKIGPKAVSNYMVENPNVSKYEAQNAVCEQFLSDYGEYNFLNSLKSKFKSVQFFTVSALGHNADGTPFKAENVEDPVLWILDKICPTINLKSIKGEK